MATQEYSASVEDERGHYVVVMQAPAGFYFGRNDPLNTMQFPSLLGPVEITFGTARTRLDGFENPVRAGLWADARGNAPTLSEAVEVFANFTRGVAAVLSVAANAPVGRFTADLAFDNTPGRHEREYFRQSYLADPQVPSQGRRLDSTLALALFTGWMQKPVKELGRECLPSRAPRVGPGCRNPRNEPSLDSCRSLDPNRPPTLHAGRITHPRSVACPLGDRAQRPRS
jgi:hypothetical protein